MSNKKTEKFWDKASDSFDKGEARFDEFHKKTLGTAKEYLKPTDNVLDFGCATGTKTLAIAPGVKTIEGIDISPKMIEKAKQKAIEQKIENTTFNKDTPFSERFQKESYDAILAFSIFHLLENRQDVLQRFWELLKPAGLLISITPCLNEKMALKNRLEFFAYLLVMKLGLMPLYLKRFTFNEVEDMIKKANLHIIYGKKDYYKLSGYFIIAGKNK